MRMLALALLLAAGCGEARKTVATVQQRSDLLERMLARRELPPSTSPAGTVAWAPETPRRPPRTRALLQHGRERYDVYCAICHGLAGDGDAPLARRMDLKQPGAVTSTNVRAMSDDALDEIIDRGRGYMPPLGAALPPDDRWAVVGYLRALQLSRSAALAALPPPVRDEATRALRGGTP